tara:strand:+ start:140 stop:478 length:339 start_codon:yes stop_codon:yes gene_type:complete
VKNKILTTLSILIIIATAFFYKEVQEIKDVYAHAFVMISLFISALLFLITDKGKKILKFLKLTNLESKKIHWAKKAEVIPLTGRVLLILIVSVIIISLFDNLINSVITSTLY